MPVFVDNRELLDEFRRGSRRAKESIYRAYVDDVTRLVRGGFTTGSVGRVPGFTNPSDCAELIQEIFIRAFTETARTAYDGLRPYRPYLLQIARNLIIDQVRKKSVQEVSYDASGLINLDAVLARNAPLPNIEERLDWHEQQDATRRYVAELAPEVQEFVRLRFVEGQAQETVATSMGLSRKRVRTLEKDTIQGLARFLREDENQAPRENTGPQSSAYPYRAVRVEP